MKKQSKLEGIKSESDYLRGTISEVLSDEEATKFTEADKQVLKFHGIYQQDDRDSRREGKKYSFMVRARIPGGQLKPEQYLALDELSDRYSNSTLRLTTRQTVQFHGILKGRLKAAIAEINDSLITTMAACGDVVRNVMFDPAPFKTALHREIEEVAQTISSHFLPQTNAYHEIWLDGEKLSFRGTAEAEEPIYGKSYLPRKFKIALALPPDNSVDVYTQDVGLVAIIEDNELQGFNLWVGGGMGMTHRKPETFPRLSDPIAYVPKEHIVEVVEHVVRIQRQEGDRGNRKHARLKYLLHDWGVETFRKELEAAFGQELEAVRPVPTLQQNLHLGWHEQGDGRWFVGVSVENGRIHDIPGLALRTGLRETIRRFTPTVILTPSQDILLGDIEESHKTAVEALLRGYGIPMAGEVSLARRNAMACPAMPTCGLAIAESERVLPSFVDQVEALQEELGLSGEEFSIRMTGCPNGCARPYVADIGLVGRARGKYTLFLGGSLHGERLNRVYQDMVKFDELIDVLRPVFQVFKAERLKEEGFGTFCARLGMEELQHKVESLLSKDTDSQEALEALESVEESRTTGSSVQNLPETTGTASN
jgi:sulfite reductase (ferredoxin)